MEDSYKDDADGRSQATYHQPTEQFVKSVHQAAVAATPGQQAIVLTALFIGLLFLGIQLWLLTVALDLYLSGLAGPFWLLPLVSGLIFLGGLFVLRVIDRQRPPNPGNIDEAKK